MDMIGDATIDVAMPIQTIDDAAEINVKRGLVVNRNPGFSIFGAENDVLVQRRIG